MPWTSTIALDADKVDVGSVTATFTDADSTTFTYTARLRATAADLNSFVAAARAARDIWKTQKTSQTNYQTIINNSFTTAGG